MHDFGGAVSKLYENSSEIQENSYFSELKVISELEPQLVSGCPWHIEKCYVSNRHCLYSKVQFCCRWSKKFRTVLDDQFVWPKPILLSSHFVCTDKWHVLWITVFPLGPTSPFEPSTPAGPLIPKSQLIYFNIQCCS